MSEVLTVTCHGRRPSETHGIDIDDARLLLEGLSGGDWEDGPRCLLDVLEDLRGSPL